MWLSCMSDIVDEIHTIRGAGRYGVIDVGYNSIRLVIFEGLNRSLNVVFNEKISCGRREQERIEDLGSFSCEVLWPW